MGLEMAPCGLASIKASAAEASLRKWRTLDPSSSPSIENRPKNQRDGLEINQRLGAVALIAFWLSRIGKRRSCGTGEGVYPRQAAA